MLVEALRRVGLAGTEWAEYQAETIRLRLLKIAAQVRITARKIWIRYAKAYPWKNAFVSAWAARAVEETLKPKTRLPVANQKAIVRFTHFSRDESPLAAR